MQVKTVTSRSAPAAGKKEAKGAVPGGDFLSILKNRTQSSVKEDTATKRTEVNDGTKTDAAKESLPAGEEADVSSDKAEQERSDVVNPEKEGTSEEKVKEKNEVTGNREELTGLQAAAEELMAGSVQAAESREKPEDLVTGKVQSDLTAVQKESGLFGGLMKEEATEGKQSAEPVLQVQTETEAAKQGGVIRPGREILQVRSEFKVNGTLNGEKSEDAAAKEAQAAKNAGSGGEEGSAGAGKEGSKQDSQAGQKLFSLDYRTSLKGLRESKATADPQEFMAVDDLQKKAEQNSFLTSMRMAGTRITGSVKAPVLDHQNVPQTMPLTAQVRTGIEQGIAKSLNEFTIRLKPEGLGEIMVHMVSTGGKIALSIGVSNTETQRLLSSEMMHLKETLQPLNAEVSEIYHNSQSGMEMMNYEQGFYQNQQNMAGNLKRHVVSYTEEETDGEQYEESLTATMPEPGRLSAYI